MKSMVAEDGIVSWRCQTLLSQGPRWETSLRVSRAAVGVIADHMRVSVDRIAVAAHLGRAPLVRLADLHALLRPTLRHGRRHQQRTSRPRTQRCHIQRGKRTRKNPLPQRAKTLACWKPPEVHRACPAATHETSLCRVPEVRSKPPPQPNGVRTTHLTHSNPGYPPRRLHTFISGQKIASRRWANA